MTKHLASPRDSADSRLPPTAVITCAVLELEIEHFASNLPHIVHIETLEQGLHNDPPKLKIHLQQAVDRIEQQTTAQAIVLGYGLCSRGTEGVRATRCQVVMPRAHDCITLLLGCKKRYAEYVQQCPGTYWYSPGWNKHHTPPGQDRYDQLVRQYRQKYGEDNARYLMETEQNWFSTYDRATYVDLGISDTADDVQYTQGCAKWLGWQFDHQRGDPELLRALLEGRWDQERFVVVPPGQTFRMTGDYRVIEVSTDDSIGSP